MKRVKLKITILLAFLLFGISEVNASHVKGGWMSYRYLGKDNSGNLTYEVLIKLYRSCDDDGPNDPRMYVSIFRTGDTAVVRTYTAPNTGSYDIKKQDFHPCLSPVPNVCYTIKEYKVVIAVAPNEAGYTIATQGCCRIGGIRNIMPPSRQVGYTYTVKIPGFKNNASHMENNSPLFIEKDTVAICRNTRFKLEYGAKDPDGDSLVYFLTPALNGGSLGNTSPNPTSPPPFQEIVYNTNFSGENPFNTLTEIDKNTGVITGFAPSNVGEYVLSVHVNEFRDGILIATTRKELHVNIANCSIPEAELPAESINCDSYQMKFENLSSSPAINSYYWDFGVPGAPNNNSTLANPSFNYPDTGTFVVKLIVNKGDACSDSAFTQVKIYPGFKPGFITAGTCFNTPVQFIDTSKISFGQISSWQWNFGDTLNSSNTSSLQNPEHRFTSSGLFPISLRIISNKGCDKTILSSINVLDIANLSLAFRDTVICGNDSIQLQAIGTGQFSWNPNNGTISNRFISNPYVFPSTSTTYIVQLSENGCSNTDSVKVNVISSFAVNAGADTTICLGDSVQLNAQSAIATSFSWSPSNNINHTDIPNPVVWPILPLTAYVVSATFGKCTEFDTIIVRTAPYPIANAGDNVSFCQGGTVTLQGTGSGNRFQWEPSASLASPNSAITQASPTETTIFTLYVFDDQGCTKPGTSNVLVRVVPSIQVNAGRDTVMVVGQTLQLNAVSTGTQHIWNPATGLSSSSNLSPVLTLSSAMVPAGTQYLTYHLTSRNVDGCEASDEIMIRVFSSGPSIFIPTAFTPNSDGLNDKIKPILAGIRQLEYFRIFNRYGQVVFETKNPETGWDGTINGKPQLSGNYIYQLQAIDINGEIIKQNGTFFLIK